LLTSWKKVFLLDPSNKTAKEFIEKVESSKKEDIKSKPQAKKKTKKTNTSKTKRKIEESTDSLNVSVRLATFTLVNVLKNQALFYQALEVLDLLEQKGEDPDMIRLERNSVKELIKTTEKENKKS
jgi:hypothetical protein